MQPNANEPERAALAAVDTGAHNPEESLAELAELARTAGAVVVLEVTQQRESPDNALYFGKGKLEELKAACEAQGIDLVIFDDELTPSQQKHIEKQLNPSEGQYTDERKTCIRVVDRTMLILDIFSQRAQSSEGKLQVDLAQLKYSLPRLTGQWYGLSRQGGGIGTRGRGETKYETDRRHVQARIRKLEEQLKGLEQKRALLRARRKKNRAEVVAIVGYTNVGKSTLLNTLTSAGVLAEVKLFATLDPTARALTLPGGRKVMLVDTVGLVRRLPHHLVEAFHSTLEEAASADVILNVCDIASPGCQEQLRVAADTLHSLGCDAIPVLRVMNKCDLAPPGVFFGPGSVSVSAKTGAGLNTLLQAIEALLPQNRRAIRLLLPYSQSAWGAKFRAEGRVDAEEFREDGIYYEALVPAQWLSALGEWIL
ncbi:MAG: GTPase HflX [Oscillospiraceae bacterium]|nr:GTPase HflX [Oscillospiraceae bacterium]